MKDNKIFLALYTGALILASAAGTYFTYNHFNNRNPIKSQISQNIPSLTTPSREDTNLINRIQNTSKVKSRKILNWNFQIFGDKKASNSTLMDFYVNTITNFDIAFVQEIRDHDDSAFNTLAARLTNYECRVSSRAGRSSSKEQYGIISKKGIMVREVVDHNPDNENRWERPPVEVLFDVDGSKIRVYNIHLKPEAVKAELAALETIVSTNGSSVVLGDLNADCNYYNNSANNELDSWHWVITDEQDTTSKKTDCAYDRIILNEDAYKNYSTSGVFKTGITPEISDHYGVWVELKTSE